MTLHSLFTLALLFAHGPGKEAGQPPAALCSPGSGDTALFLSGGNLREWPDGGQIWSGKPLLATALACSAGSAAIGVGNPGSERDGWIILLSRGAAGWRIEGEIETPGVPRDLLLFSGRLAAVLENRRIFSLAMMDARPGAKILKLPVKEAPSGLAASPDGGNFLIAVGNNLRSFRVEDGRTWMIFPFAEPIGAIASRPGVSRMLVSQASAVVAVDPRDKATRGALPVRARVELPAPPAVLAWTGDGGIAAALIEDPPRLIFLDGESLAILDQREIPAAAIAPLGPGRIAWLSGLGDARVGEATLAAQTIAAAGKPASARVPEPPARPDAPRETPAPTPPAERPASPAGAAPAGAAPPAAATEGYPPVKPEHSATPEPPAPKPPAKLEAPPEPPAPKPPAKVEALPEPPVPKLPAKVEAPPERPAPKLPAKAEPPPEMPAPKLPVKAEAPPEPPVPKLPAKAEAPPETPAPKLPAKAEPPPEPPAPSQVAAPTEHIPGDTERLAQAIPPGGTIAGRLAGERGLVDTLVILGPDSILKEQARAKPVSRDGAIGYVASGLPPGRYRVVPMGKGGTSLASQPTFATVSVTSQTGARADFTIQGSL